MYSMIKYDSLTTVIIIKKYVKQPSKMETSQLKLSNMCFYPTMISGE